MIYRCAIPALLLAVLWTGCPHPAGAVQLHASLAPIKIEGRPGQVVTRSHSLTLGGDERPTRFKVHAEDWWRSEDGKRSFYEVPGTLASSCASWVKVNPVEAVVKPGQALVARVTVSIPAQVRPGGYWCALTIDELPDPLQSLPDRVGVRFLASVSVGIFVTVAPVTRSARIEEVQIQSGRVVLKLFNTGNCPLGVEGRVEFLRPGDTKPTATSLLPRGTLLPEPIRTALFSAELPDAKRLPSGRYQVQVVLDIGLEYLIGARKEIEIRHEAPTAPGPSPATH